jgi:hypothetical protein
MIYFPEVSPRDAEGARGGRVEKGDPVAGTGFLQQIEQAELVESVPDIIPRRILN